MASQLLHLALNWKKKIATLEKKLGETDLRGSNLATSKDLHK